MNHQSIYSFSSLLRQLQARQAHLSGEHNVAAVSDYIERRADKLEQCANPFGSPNSASRSKVESGKVVDDEGRSVELKEADRRLCKAAAERLVLDEVEAARLFLLWRRDRQSEVKTEDLEHADDFWTDFTALVFEERLRIIEVVAYLLRIVPAQLDASQPPSDTSRGQEVLRKVLAPIQTPRFTSSLLQRFVHLARTPVPSSAAGDAPLWARQHVREQKILLEVYFTLYYNRMYPDGRAFLEILGAIEQTGWASLQMNEGYFDDEASTLAEALPALITIVALELLNLDRAASPEVEDYDIPSTGTTPHADSIIHPDTFAKIHSKVMELAHESRFPAQSGPVLLAWAFILYRITATIKPDSLPTAYFDIADRLLPVSQHPQRSNSIATSSSASSAVIRNSSSTSPPDANQAEQPFYQTLLAHALHNPQISALDRWLLLLQSPPLQIRGGSSRISFYEPNLLGYLSVALSLLSTVLATLDLAALTSVDFAKLVDIFQALYSNPGALPLRAAFWEVYNDTLLDVPRGHCDLLSLAQDRFPCDTGSLLVLVDSLSKTTGSYADSLSVEDEAQYAAYCARNIVEYLSNLLSATQFEPPVSPLVPLPYESASDMEADSFDVVSVRPIPISPSVSIPEGMPGRIVSPEDVRPAVIRWDLSQSQTQHFSAWQYFGDLLLDFLGQGSHTAEAPYSGSEADVFGSGQGISGASLMPIQWSSEPEQQQAMTMIFDVLYTCLSHCDLTDYSAEDVLGRFALTNPSRVVVRVLQALDVASSGRIPEEAFYISSMRLITVLLQYYPGIVWTYLKGNFFSETAKGTRASLRAEAARGVYDSQNAILSEAKLRGRYSYLLAQVDLVAAMLLDVQRSVHSANPGDLAKTRGEVLYRAYRWMVETVWANFESWRYAQVREKYELASKLAGLFLVALQEAEASATSHQDGLSLAIRYTYYQFFGNHSQPLFEPIVRSILHSADAVRDLRAVGRNMDATAAEACLQQQLRLTRQIVGMSGETGPGLTSTLASMLFSYPGKASASAASFRLGDAPDPSSTPIAALFNLFIASDFQSDTAILAARVLTRLTVLSGMSGDAPSRASFLGHLGSNAYSIQVARAVLDIAGDPFIEEETQLCAWELIAALVPFQPGLSELLLKGTRSFAPIESLGRNETAQIDIKQNAIDLATEVISSSDQSWESQPSLLLLALTALLNVARTYEDRLPGWKTLKDSSTFCANICQIVQRQVGAAPDVTANLQGVSVEIPAVEGWCFRRAAQAQAINLLTAMVEQGSGDTDLPAPLREALSKIISAQNSGDSVVSSLSEKILDPVFLVDASAAFKEAFGIDRLETYQRPVGLGDILPYYGADFRYSTSILEPRLSASVVRSDAMLDQMNLQAVRDSAEARLLSANLMWSMFDAQSSYVDAIGAFFSTVLPRTSSNKSTMAFVPQATLTLLQVCADERRPGDVVQALHAKRLSILRTLLENAGAAEQIATARWDTSKIFRLLRTLLFNDTVNPLESLARPQVGAGSSFHEEAFGVAFLLFQVLGQQLSGLASSVPPSSGLDQKTRSATVLDIEACIAAGLQALQICLSTGLRGGFQDAGQSLSTVTSMLQAVLRIPGAARTASWLAQCQEQDSVRLILEFLATAPITDATSKHHLDLLALSLVMARYPEACERMAVAGFVTAMTNNALSATLDREHPASVSTGTSGSYEPSADPARHEIWCASVDLLGQIVHHLGYSVPFMENDVAAFLYVYSRQIERGFDYTPADGLASEGLRDDRSTLTVASIHEMQAVSTLLQVVVLHGGAKVRVLQPILRKLVNRSLLLLQQLVYLLQHPTSLSKLVEPLNAEQRAWLQPELESEETISLADFSKKLVAAAVIQAVFGLCQNIVSILVVYTSAIRVATREDVDWPQDPPIIRENTNTSLGEPASQGTLIDLARSCLEAAGVDVDGSSSGSVGNKGSDSSLTVKKQQQLATQQPLASFDRARFTKMMTFMHESIVVLMATQLALSARQLTEADSRDRSSQRARSDLHELATDFVDEFLGTDSAPSRKSGARLDDKLAGILRSLMIRCIV